MSNQIKEKIHTPLTWYKDEFEVKNKYFSIVKSEHKSFNFWAKEMMEYGVNMKYPNLKGDNMNVLWPSIGMSKGAVNSCLKALNQEQSEFCLKQIGMIHDKSLEDVRRRHGQ